MKKIWLIGLIILTVGLWSNLAFGESADFKPGSEPDGFRGIKWGTDIKTLSSMKYVETGPLGIEYYTREHDFLHIRRVNLEKILYGFYNKKFYGVEITAEKGYANYKKLKEILFEKFGEGSPKKNWKDGFSWGGDITRMSLSYAEPREWDKSSNKALLFMTSVELGGRREFGGGF